MTKEQLVNLITENPDAEILFMCGEESWSGDYGYSSYSLNEVKISVKELAFFGEKWFDNDEELKEYVEDYLFDCFGHPEFADEEIQKHPFKKYIVIKIG